MSSSKPPLWKQLLGAVGGAAVALLLYGGYTFGERHLSAYITIPEMGIFSGDATPVRTSARKIPEDEFERIALKARQVADTYGRRIEIEEPRYDVIEDSDYEPVAIAVEEEPVAEEWQSRIGGDWWNTQEDWAEAEDIAQNRAGATPAPTLVASTVSADVSVHQLPEYREPVAPVVRYEPAPILADVRRSEARALPNSGPGMGIAMVAGAAVALRMLRRRLA